MSVFAVMSITPNAALAPKIASVYPQDNFTLTNQIWFVSDSNVTAAQVCEKLGITSPQLVAGISNVVVVGIQSYFGHATNALWQWLALKGVTP